MAISLRHMEVLNLFVRTRSVTETARLLRISQPAVSQTIKEIERDFGFPVLIRVSGRTQLTDELRAIMPDLQRLLGQASTLKGRVAEVRDARSGSLTISSVPTLFNSLLPRALAGFMKDHDRVEVSADVRLRDEVLQEVRSDNADIGFAFLPFDETGLAVQPIIEMQVACVLPINHHLAQRDIIRAEDIPKEFIIIQDTHASPGSTLGDALHKHIAQHSHLKTNQSTAAFHMVANGMGIALIQPITCVGGYHPDVVVKPYYPEIMLTLAMVYSRKRQVGRLVVKFEKHFRTVIEDFAKDLNQVKLKSKILI